MIFGCVTFAQMRIPSLVIAVVHMRSTRLAKKRNGITGVHSAKVLCWVHCFCNVPNPFKMQFPNISSHGLGSQTPIARCLVPQGRCFAPFVYHPMHFLGAVRQGSPTSPVRVPAHGPAIQQPSQPGVGPYPAATADGLTRGGGVCRAGEVLRKSTRGRYDCAT